VGFCEVVNSCDTRSPDNAAPALLTGLLRGMAAIIAFSLLRPQACPHGVSALRTLVLCMTVHIG
jgi:hypothetical protein